MIDDLDVETKIMNKGCADSLLVPVPGTVLYCMTRLGGFVHHVPTEREASLT